MKTSHVDEDPMLAAGLVASFEGIVEILSGFQT